MGPVWPARQYRYRDVTTQIAILIPAYNCASTIADTVNSLQQIGEGWEYVDRVLICDDASADATWSVLQSIEFDKCPLTLLRHEKNSGESACYGTMLKVLSDSIRWFLVLHADDLALPNFLKRNYGIMARCNDRVAAVSSNYITFGPGNERLAHSPAEDTTVFRDGAEQELVHTALVGCWWHISGSLINRDLWQKFGGRRAEFPQVGDWDLMLRWQMAGYAVGHSLIPTTKYRLNSGSSLSSKSYLRFSDIGERTAVILGLPEIFSRSVRRKWAVRVARDSIRRACRLIASGKPLFAIRGALVSAQCVASLLKPQPRDLAAEGGSVALRH